MNKNIYVLILLIVLVLTGCTAKTAADPVLPATYNVTGNWEYTLSVPGGNVYDEGTIEFTGTASEGTWSLLNFYDVEYNGTYTMIGNTITLTGDETWDGSFADADHISGQWRNNEESGEWKASRKN